MKKRILRGLAPLLLMVFVFPAGCNVTASLIETARFLMDQCDPAEAPSADESDACSQAAAKTEIVLDDDATNLEAATLNSSAHLGLAGLEFLDIAEQLTDLQESDNSGNDFSQFQDLVATIEETRAINLDELTLAQERLLIALTGVDAAPSNESDFFQLGLLQAVDAFIRPAKLAGDNAANADTAITEAVTIIVEANFIAADNNLVLGGTTDTDVLGPIRNNYCFCKINAGGFGGFDTTCLRDLMKCELAGAAATPSQDYDASGTPNALDCTTLLSTAAAGFSACATDTTP